MNYLTLVQHHPRRADLLPALLADLPANTQVVGDSDPTSALRSPWRTYRRCLEVALENNDLNHCVIVQDDVTVCLDFGETVAKVIAARPDAPICLFLPGLGEFNRRVLDACWNGRHWCDLDYALWVPVVAVAWPRACIESLLAFADEKRYPPSRFGDDSIAGDWMRETRARVVGCVPSLVEHPDEVASLVGTASFGGVNPGRCASCWAGREWSPLEIDWTH